MDEELEVVSVVFVGVLALCFANLDHDRSLESVVSIVKLNLIFGLIINPVMAQFVLPLGRTQGNVLSGQ